MLQLSFPLLAAVGTTTMILLLLCVEVHAHKIHGPARGNITCMLVFGDSTVDPGNNNWLPTSFKANFAPYGKDFFHGLPTGRFSNGRLATDFLAESLGISTSIPAFLDPNLSPQQLKSGVSFASASSGYDELTATNADVLSFPKQIEYLQHYKIHLIKSVGFSEAQNIINNAIVIISSGTNDFLQNYYFNPDRSKQFTESQYEQYLVSLISKYIKAMKRVGVRRILLVGVPPMGCVPIVRTLMNTEDCYLKFNRVAMSFNSKIVAELSVLEKQLGIKTAYLDIYQVVEEATKYPAKYGIAETVKGCCGSGMTEIGETCKDQSTCKDPSKYLFWDAIHPTQKVYKIVADLAVNDVVDKILK